MNLANKFHCMSCDIKFYSLSAVCPICISKIAQDFFCDIYHYDFDKTETFSDEVFDEFFFSDIESQKKQKKGF